jgi:hypothetical protein
LALPLDQEAFFTDYNAGPERDYVRSMVRGRLAREVWAEEGLPLAELCHELLALASGLGVRTVASAQLLDIGHLVRERKVITIVAHWRGAAFVGTDFIEEPIALIEAIRSGKDPVCCDLDRRLPSARIDQVFALPEARQCSELAEVLNDVVIRSDRPLPGAVEKQNGNVPIVIDELSLRSRQRARLDAAFPSLLRPGNRVELRDGLYGPAPIAASFPEGWSGIVDFAICQSAYLAHEVKNGRPERRVITNLHEVVPGVRLRIQKELYRRLARRGNYANELTALFVALAGMWPPTEPTGILQRLRQGLRMGG